MFLGTILLALAWAALRGDFSLGSLVTGYLVGYLVVYLLGKGGVLHSHLTAKVKNFFALAGFFAWELVLANLRIAHDVIHPRRHMRPGVVAIPLDARTDEEILLLSAMINITPGSVTIDVTDDRRTMYVHVMHMETPAHTRREIKDGFEQRVLRLLR